ncbi:hypothetical protein RRG08_021270 [Elysia crispata]|uniref:Uncharacterized protein n=1 Tax=Elysia crispata TaxID=231223 RepID=A0AAE0YU28_9GAST|nr:hypothetical protein RRG08_021270 [Elysia crispata]
MLFFLQVFSREQRENDISSLAYNFDMTLTAASGACYLLLGCLSRMSIRDAGDGGVQETRRFWRFSVSVKVRSGAGRETGTDNVESHRTGIERKERKYGDGFVI